jgi:hypothetical protein
MRQMVLDRAAKHAARRPVGAWLCPLAVALALSGCAAGPLVVSAVQSRGSEVKFGYTQARGGKQGIIECQAADGGDLHSCRHMDIEFVD